MYQIGFTIAVIKQCQDPIRLTPFAFPSSASQPYFTHLISPTAAQVIYPQQKIRVEWTSTLPRIDLAGCEAEAWLSLDRGKTVTMCITPVMDPKAQYFYWTVPNTPANTAVLDIRLGCEGWYPESCAPQPASMFTIATSTVPSYKILPARSNSTT
jgi:hypothetical protein